MKKSDNKKVNVYKVEEKLEKTQQWLCIISIIAIVGFGILILVTKQSIFLYFILGTGVFDMIISILTLPIAIWIERQKIKLRDKEKFYQTFNRFK